MNSPPGGSRIFPELRKLPPIPPIICGLYPVATSPEEIKLWNKRVSPSEGSEITAVVSYVAGNLERYFLGLTSTQQGVTESVKEMRQRVNTLYSDAKEVCDQLGATNLLESTFVERLSNMEHIVHTKISQRLQDLQAGISSCKEILQKDSRWRNQYSSRRNFGNKSWICQEF